MGDYIQAVLDRNLAENISRVLYPNDNVRTHTSQYYKTLSEMFVCVCVRVRVCARWSDCAERENREQEFVIYDMCINYQNIICVYLDHVDAGMQHMVWRPGTSRLKTLILCNSAKAMCNTMRKNETVIWSPEQQLAYVMNHDTLVYIAIVHTATELYSQKTQCLVIISERKIYVPVAQC